MKKLSIRFLALFLAVLIVLSGCTAAPVDGTTQRTDATAEKEVNQTDTIPDETTASQDEKEELWVVIGTDSKTGYPPVAHFEQLFEQIAQKYPDVAVRLEGIPKDEEALQRLRIQIMAGKGPDMMVMCRNDTLIPDPIQAMRNGLFMDISEYYDTDTSIKKEELNQTIMDAGVYDGCRYIIPYSFDFPVAYIDAAQFESLGGSMDMFDGGIMKLYENFFATENPSLIWGASLSRPSQRFHSFNYLPDMLDYEAQEVLITAEDVAQFLRAVQKARAAQPFDVEDLPYPTYLNEPSFTVADIRQYKKTWLDYTSMYIGVMSEHILNLGYLQISGSDLEIKAIPVAAADGDLVADVLWYGAVGAGCKNPELAYAFLSSIFKDSNNETYFNPYGLTSIGWSVRIPGSAESLASQYSSISVFEMIAPAYPNAPDPEITNDDIPFLDAKIDRVQFYTSLEHDLSSIIDTLNDPNTGAPTDVDIDAVAADFVKELEWHLYEG